MASGYHYQMAEAFRELGPYKNAMPQSVRYECLAAQAQQSQKPGIAKKMAIKAMKAYAGKNPEEGLQHGTTNSVFNHISRVGKAFGLQKESREFDNIAMADEGVRATNEFRNARITNEKSVRLVKKRPNVFSGSSDKFLDELSAIYHKPNQYGNPRDQADGAQEWEGITDAQRDRAADNLIRRSVAQGHFHKAATVAGWYGLPVAGPLHTIAKYLKHDEPLD
ncbi:hypothetical protein HY994_02480 [Candidatus Micrarchaeota archaeon]|nr:hypothetical protein [Candidatus Micrarchaeota archaeon]